VKTNIFVPQKINVGYQKRSDTYTGNLAYIIYYDEQGILRKETSWENWRDKNIPNEVFDNVPIEGFVLNKKVGDYSGSWGDHRQAYCRVYDPRNFEFEITINNLLYILENTSAIKGKGLEGEFVYGWDGKDLLLMPAGSPDYKTISEFNKIIHDGNQIKAKDLIVGATYLTKDNTELIYVGKFDYYSSGYKWLQNGEYKTSKNSKDILRNYGSYNYCDYECVNNFGYGKYFWFARKCEDGWKFEKLKSIPKTKFIRCVNEKCTDEYSEIHKALDNSCEYSPYEENLDKMVDASLELFISRGKEKHWRDDSFYYTSIKFVSKRDGDYKTYAACPRSSDENLFTVKKYHKRDMNRGSYGFLVGFEDEFGNLATLEEIYEKMKPMYRQCYLKNGNEYRKEWSL
jgi:hypothetical protein